jgi:hypothetical protein
MRQRDRQITGCYYPFAEHDTVAFEPADRIPLDWHAWVSPGARLLRGRTGSFTHILARVPRLRQHSGREVRAFF